MKLIQLLILSFVAEDLPDRFEDLPGFATMPAAEKTTYSYTADAPWTKMRAACEDRDETGACLSAGGFEQGEVEQGVEGGDFDRDEQDDASPSAPPPPPPPPARRRRLVRGPRRDGRVSVRPPPVL